MTQSSVLWSILFSKHIKSYICIYIHVCVNVCVCVCVCVCVWIHRKNLALFEQNFSVHQFCQIFLPILVGLKFRQKNEKNSCNDVKIYFFSKKSIKIVKKKLPLFVAKGLKEGNKQGTTWGQSYKTFYGRNLWIFVIS